MENHNIKYPCIVKNNGNSQSVIVDASGAWICNTISGTDTDNAQFIAETLNNALKKDV